MASCVWKGLLILIFKTKGPVIFGARQTKSTRGRPEWNGQVILFGLFHGKIWYFSSQKEDSEKGNKKRDWTQLVSQKNGRRSLWPFPTTHLSLTHNIFSLFFRDRTTCQVQLWKFPSTFTKSSNCKKNPLLAWPWA